MPHPYGSIEDLQLDECSILDIYTGTGIAIYIQITSIPILHRYDGTMPYVRRYAPSIPSR